MPASASTSRSPTRAAACALAAVLLAGCAGGRGEAEGAVTRFGLGGLNTWTCADGVTVEVQPIPSALPELRGHTGQLGQAGTATSGIGGTLIRLRAGGPGAPVVVLLPAQPSASAGATDVDRWRSSDGGTEWFGRRGGAMTLRDATTSRLTARDCRLRPG